MTDTSQDNVAYLTKRGSKDKTGNRRKPPATYGKLQLNQLFLDAVNEEIHAGNTADKGVRRQHGVEGNGYQRDPYIRIKWVQNRVINYSNDLLRPLEVSDRGDGTYAVIDGGGRWLLAQLVKKTEVDCRIHTGLTREEEAELFFKFDREIYRLRAVDVYLAALAAGHPTIVEIDKAISPPYKISKSGGAASFDGVGALYDIFHYERGGARLIRRTANVVANTWGGLKKGGVFEGSRVNGLLFGSVAMILDVAPQLEPALRGVMLRKDYAPAKLLKKVEDRIGDDRKATTVSRQLLAAKILMQRANADTNGKDACKPSVLEDCDLLNVFEARAGGKIAFGSKVAADSAA